MDEAGGGLGLTQAGKPSALENATYELAASVGLPLKAISKREQ